jgi:hypothetical protein
MLGNYCGCHLSVQWLRPRMPTLICQHVDFLPVYFQVCNSASPIRSGVQLLPFACSVGATLIVAGASVAITKQYRIQLWFSWAATMIAMGVLSAVHANTPEAHPMAFPVLLGVGAGIVYCVCYFPVLAPLPVSENAHALALLAFLRSFAAVCARFPAHSRSSQ